MKEGVNKIITQQLYFIHRFLEIYVTTRSYGLIIEWKLMSAHF